MTSPVPEKPNIFQDILNTRSLTVIHYKVEDALKTADSNTAETLHKIYELNSLDKIWVICHGELGQVEEAAKILDYYESKNPRRTRNLNPPLSKRI